MLTTQQATSETIVLIAHPSEKTPSPKDVKRRMLQVQSAWDATERVERRRRARARFQSLMEILEQQDTGR